MNDQYPSRELDKVIIRLPDGLKERVRRAAEANGRSVNSELVTLLDRTYPADTTIDECLEAIASIIDRSPPSERDQAWATVFSKLEKLRGKSL